MTRRNPTLLFVLTAAVLAAPAPLYAYGGPGSVVTGIGALLAALAAVAAAVFGFFWFPLKRLFEKLRDDDEETDAAGAS